MPYQKKDYMRYIIVIAVDNFPVKFYLLFY